MHNDCICRGFHIWMSSQNSPNMGRIEGTGYYVDCSSWPIHQNLYSIHFHSQGINILKDSTRLFNMFTAVQFEQLETRRKHVTFQMNVKSVIRNFVFSVFHPMAGRLFRTLQVLQRFPGRGEYAKPLSKEVLLSIVPLFDYCFCPTGLSFSRVGTKQIWFTFIFIIPNTVPGIW